jgi:hypothetical protein
MHKHKQGFMKAFGMGKGLHDATAQYSKAASFRFLIAGAWHWSVLIKHC